MPKKISSAKSESPWGADCPISMPVALEDDPGQVVDFGGLAFITMGLRHNMTAVDREAILAEGYGPGPGPSG